MRGVSGTSAQYPHSRACLVLGWARPWVKAVLRAAEVLGSLSSPVEPLLKVVCRQDMVGDAGGHLS